MTAAPLPRCPVCLDRPHHLDAGCVRCQDGAGEPVRPPLDPPRLAVHVYAVERASSRLAALPGVFHPGSYPDRQTLANRLARHLSWDTAVADTLRDIRDVAGLDEAGARKVLEAYVGALREHARAVRPRREPRTPDERERAAVARQCERYAERMELALPEWARGRR